MKQPLQKKKTAVYLVAQSAPTHVNKVAGHSGGGGGGYLTKFYTGRLPPRGPTLTLSYTILAERHPFYIPFIEKRYPFHIPILGSLVLVFMYCSINELLQP